MKHSLRAFRHRNYRLFFSGQLLSLIGTWIQQLATGWLVYRLTGSAWLLGVTAFASQIAMFVLAPFGGLWADRVDRRKLLLATQILAMVQGLALAALAYSGMIEVWHIVVMAGLLGVVMAFDMPIRQSFTLEMVPDKADLPSAIAFNGFMQNTGRMIGPAIAGMMLHVSSEAFCFLLNGVSKIAVIAAILAMNVRSAPRAPHAGLWSSLKEGVRYAKELAPARWLLPVLAVVSFTITPYQALMPIFAAEVFVGGADTLGFLMGAAGIGGVAGLLCLAARQQLRGLTRWTVAGAAVAGTAMFSFAYSPYLPLSLVLVGGVGFGMMLTAMSVSTILQTVSEDSKRGRVMSFYTMAFMGMQPLGSLAAGALASWIGARHALALGGLCSVLCGYVLWRRLPSLREELRPLYQALGIPRS
ncbi:MAG: MFS transporter [Rhodospirillaceae bacterium]